MKKVIAYIDGYNVYYGLRNKGWKRFYWLNYQEAITRLLKPDQTLVEIKYFTTVVKHPSNRHKRQAVYLDALSTLKNFNIFYGHFLSSPFTGNNCGYTHRISHEKMTDVNIAVELMVDAFNDNFDTAMLVSADSDLLGPINAVKKQFSGKKNIVIAFPPKRYSKALARNNHHIFLNRNILEKSQFPETVVLPSGHKIKRPPSWK